MMPGQGQEGLRAAPEHVYAELPPQLFDRLREVAEGSNMSPYRLTRILLARYLGRRYRVPWASLVCRDERVADASGDPGYLAHPEARNTVTLDCLNDDFRALLRQELLAFGLSEQEWVTCVLFRYLSDRDADVLEPDMTTAFGYPRTPLG